MFKFYVHDISNDFLLCITDDYETALSMAKEYTKDMFEALDKYPGYEEHYPEDMVKFNLIGFDISTVEYNKFSNKLRENHFWGYITKDGEVLNRNEMMEE